MGLALKVYIVIDEDNKQTEEFLTEAEARARLTLLAQNGISVYMYAERTSPYSR